MTVREVRNRLINRILANCPDIKNTSQKIKDIYNTAVEFFGEDNVDLQKNTIKEIWKDYFYSCRQMYLESKLGISPENSPFSENYREEWWDKLLINNENFKIFEPCITAETVLNSQVPLYVILIHFHDITITNENNYSTKIEDIYAAIPINISGQYIGYMHWYRTTISSNHLKADYIHSHLPSSSKYWGIPCLGSGPIVLTIETLRTNSELSFWSLFWLELNNCIRVESLDGGPYFSLQDIPNTLSTHGIFDDFNFDTTLLERVVIYRQNDFDEVVKRILQSGKLQYSYIDDKVQIATSYIEFTILASNCLLEYLHSLDKFESADIFRSIMERHILIHASITSNNKIISYGPLTEFNNNVEETNTEQRNRTKAGFSFKGEEVPFIVINDSELESTVFYELICPELATLLRTRITLIANYIYATKHSNSTNRISKK